MACHLAKPTDSRVVIHIPVLNISHNTEIDGNAPTYFSKRRFRRALKETKSTVEKLISQYKTAGFNLFVGQMPSYAEESRRVMTAHKDWISFESIACSARKRFFGSDSQKASSSYFFANLHSSQLSRKIIRVASAFSPTCLLLGSDNEDIARAISGRNRNLHLLDNNPYLSFQIPLDQYKSAIAVCRIEGSNTFAGSSALLTDKAAARKKNNGRFLSAHQSETHGVQVSSIVDEYDNDTFDAPEQQPSVGGRESDAVAASGGDVILAGAEQQSIPIKNYMTRIRAGCFFADDTDVLFDWEEVADGYLEFTNNRIPSVEMLLHMLTTSRSGAEQLSSSVVLCNKGD
jgi:hypothetical protein